MSSETPREETGPSLLPPLEGLIRPAGEGDLQRVASLWRDNILTSNTPEDIARAFREHRRFFHVLVVDGGPIQGFVAGTVKSRSRGHISGIAVQPERRRRGWGARLLEAAEETFRREGFRRVTLEVRSSNEPAIRFYEARGYRRGHRVPGYYFDGEDALTFEKWL